MQVSTNGGVAPQWRNDGREIFYLAPDNRVMAVPVTPEADGTLQMATPIALLPIPQGADYDVTPDGQRILLNKPVGQATTPPITIIQNRKPKDALGVRRR